ncbi:MAG: PIN domain-containing protein [Thermoanaerobaculia bacterium]|nr:PIN domain-containing protein [Thermoanaerobaculia bacterium]
MTSIFVDTNVLVYRYDLTETRKQRVAEEWLTALWKTRAGRISTQILQELYVTLTRKLSRGLRTGEARTIVQALEAWTPLPIEPSLIREAWRIEDRHQISFWDALVVAAALRSGSTILLTEDLQDGMEVGSLRVLDPFSTDRTGTETIHDS